MTMQVERHHWLTTYCGILDSAFFLSEEELFAVSNIIRKLLTLLQVPGRSEPVHLPMDLVQEVTGEYHSIALAVRDSGRPRIVRPVTDEDCVVSLEAWREALVDLLISAYPDIDVDHRLVMTKVFTDLLANLGVPHRAAAFHPDMVLAAYRGVDRATT